jgi:hypothetical protein
MAITAHGKNFSPLDSTTCQKNHRSTFVTACIVESSEKLPGQEALQLRWY